MLRLIGSRFTVRTVSSPRSRLERWLFRRSYRWSLEAFNAGDPVAAFATLPDRVRWHVLRELPDAPEVLSTRDEVIEYFVKVLSEFPGYRVEVLEVIDDGGGPIVARARATDVSGRGIGVEFRYRQVWEVDEGWLVMHESLEDSSTLPASELKQAR